MRLHCLSQRKADGIQEVPALQNRTRTSSTVCKHLGKGTKYYAALQTVLKKDARSFKHVAESVFWDPRHALQMLPDPLRSSLAVAFIKLARPRHQFCYQCKLFLMMVALKLRRVHRQLKKEAAAEVA